MLNPNVSQFPVSIMKGVRFTYHSSKKEFNKRTILNNKLNIIILLPRKRYWPAYLVNYLSTSQNDASPRPITLSNHEEVIKTIIIWFGIFRFLELLFKSEYHMQTHLICNSWSQQEASYFLSFMNIGRKLIV